jgi:chemotaxis protein CheD
METAEMAELIRVGMAELKVTKNPGVLNCIGLGSCIGIVLYDRITRAGGMAHIMMPDSSRAKKSDGGILNKAKYVDTAIEEMLLEMEHLGARKINIRAYVFGGANMFPELFHKDAFLNMGERNIDAVKEELARKKIKIAAEDIGGSWGRTITLYTESGRIEMKTAQGEEKVWE